MEAARAMDANAPIVIGRYALFDELAAGGMATVHLGRLLGPVGFGRTVAVKRLHAHFLRDEEFIIMFMDEARIVARIAHPNVVSMMDVVQSDQGLFLVMEYVHGESLSRLMRTARKTGEPIPERIVSAIMCAVLFGLHAAHDTKAADGALLGVVHRDVSPQNIIVGADGSARVLDFGIAKAAGRIQVTRDGQIKGKLAYMAPEQIRGQVDRRTDVFAAAVVLWEMLAGRRLHEGSKDVDIVTRVMKGTFPPPSEHNDAISPALDAIVLRGLAADPERRFASARELAVELQRQVGIASPSEVGAWVERLAQDVLEARANLVAAMELAANDLVPLESVPPAERGSGDPVSEALPALPPLPVIPISVDEPPHLDAPSSSAVFAHTQTANALVERSHGRTRLLSTLVVLLSVVLALVGIALGTFALTQRAARNAAGDPAPAPSAPPSAASSMPPVASAALVDPPAASTSAPSLSAEVPRAKPTGRGTWNGGGRVAPPAAPRPTAAPKPNCDPPYILDEVGHRHYKPECD